MATTQDEMIAELQHANEKLRQERNATLAQKAALAEVLEVINRSPGDPGPVFEAILEKAHRLCGADLGTLTTYDGEYFCTLATHGYPDKLTAFMRQPVPPSQRHVRLVLGDRFVHIPDLRAAERQSDDQTIDALVSTTDVRTFLLVPMHKDGALKGSIGAHRREVRPFSEGEITLLEGFAAQAVIAMENARLVGELRQRTSDLQELLEYQTAIGDVLKVISRSTFDLQPVLDTLVKTAARLCLADRAAIFSFKGGMARLVANFGFSPEYKAHFDAR